jgi:hypothetical protein
MRWLISPFILIIIFSSACNNSQESILYKAEKYTLYADKVEQDNYSAIALSAEEIQSNYYSTDELEVSNQIYYKFSINGGDNEMISGTDHLIRMPDGSNSDIVTKVTFGKQQIDTAGIQKKNITGAVNWKVELDLSEIFQAFEKQGYYTFFDGTKLYKEEFNTVYIAGGASFLSWDFHNLYTNPELELTDADGDHIYEVAFTINPGNKEKVFRKWELQNNISAYPQYESDHLLVDALYNMSLDELKMNIEADSTFRTGKEWAGVWTRDISYSVLLSLAAIEPQIAKISLLRKVKNGRIIQDTGTGGSWPVSTDRTTWILAAWEIYLVTGDVAWLKQVYPIIQNTLEDDLKVARDAGTGLFFGESSFLDWREQTYPRWMSPVDIFTSRCLGTNAVHYQSYKIASLMAQELNLDGSAFESIAKETSKAINENLWQEDKGYYGQFIYGQYYPILSDRSETLGEALCILFDIAGQERQNRIVNNTPVTPYGAPCIYPQIPDIPPYHNNGIWPFVEAYWAWAAAKVGNEKVLLHSLGAIYRQAALFLTNKENMVAESGDYAGTAINSDRQLWSVAGNIAMVYRVFYGMNFTPKGIEFDPFIPQSFAGEKTLSNFTYRNSILNIVINGYGSSVKTFKLDGVEQEHHVFPSDLTGKHTIEITLDESMDEAQDINLVAVAFSPDTPILDNENNKIAENKNMLVYRNGVLYDNLVIKNITGNYESNTLEEFIFVKQSEGGLQSFGSRPLIKFPAKSTHIIEAEQHIKSSEYSARDYTGTGYVYTSKENNPNLEYEILIPETGTYSIEFRYSNGAGPVNTDNNCGIRTLFANNEESGAVIFAQIGSGNWSNWYYSNAIKTRLVKGSNTLQIKLMPYNENMDGEINEALIDHIRIAKITD